MKHSFTWLAAFALSFVIGSAVNADAINPVAMSDGDVATGDVFDDDGTAPASQFWITFFANAGDTVDLDINRTAASTDLFATLAFGDVTGLDDILISGGDLDIGTSATWTAELGLTFIEDRDDDEDDAFGGPFGDPRFTFVAASTGVYTVAVVSYADPTDGAQAQANLSITSAIPEPTTSLLVGIGAFGMAIVRRRK